MWIKEQVAAREHGFRREDGLAYVGLSAGKWWRAWVATDNGLQLLTNKGFAAAKDAQWAADQWLAGQEEAA